MVWLQKGNKFLPDISKEKLRILYGNEKHAKAKLRFLAAIQRKEGKTLDDISSYLQKPKTTIHDWLQRLESKGLGNIYDAKQTGKPARLTKTQEKELDKILESSPENQNIPFVMWTTHLVQYLLLTKFNVELKVRQVRNIIKKINFTLQIPRPEHQKANKKAQEEFKKKLKLRFNIILNLDSRSSVLTRHSSE